jgi:hypothetical protein
MTALKPIENRRVRGVAAESYPSNLICAHPECDKPVDLRPSGDPTVHHIFPRSLTKSDSYFVAITDHESDEMAFVDTILPHAVGLCGSGTTGHHGDVEEHRAWIKLEEGVYVWYDRVAPTDPHDEIPEDWQEWVSAGALNPQPGSVDGKTKKKRTVKGTEERAKRTTVSIRLPEGVTGEYWDELIAEAEQVELEQPHDETEFDPSRGGVTVGKLLVAVLQRFTGRVG